MISSHSGSPRSCAGFAFFLLTILFFSIPAVHASTYGVSTTALLQQYALSINIEDEDGDFLITDRDFQLWIVDQAFSSPLLDYDCNNQLNNADAVLTLADTLRGLSADHNNTSTIDEDDIVFVVTHLFTYNSNPTKGDLNADGITDAVDLAQALERVGRPVTFNPVTVAYDTLSQMLPLEPSLLQITLPNASPCTPGPELCGASICKGTCVDPTTNSKWKYRFYMLGFCGSQFEAQECCQQAIAFACNCNSTGFTLHCWSIGQGEFISCLLFLPDE